MRKIIFILTTIIGFGSPSALADIVRHASIPEPLWGTWAASASECGETGKSSIALSAKEYIGSKGSCTVEWVDETPGVKTPNYAAHLNCAGTGVQSRKTISNVILRLSDTNQISIGADFSSLKNLQRCLTVPRR